VARDVAVSAALVVFAYLLGSVSPSVILGKLLKGIDLREHGSGNAGTTNAFRVLGTPLGIVVFVLDVAEGFLPVFLAVIYVHSHPVTTVLAATAAMAGHNWPVFLRFKGGKGVATAAGAILAMSPLVFASLIGTYAIVFLLTRIPSVGSLVATLLYPTLTIVLGQPLSYKVFSIVAAVMVFYLHRANIRRIMRGQERKADLPWRRVLQARRGGDRVKPKVSRAKPAGSGGKSE
jgi:acyl phosphate:glycerol-3-phosphate acyltransferase